jgi:poly(3-hydroxybutyrate) depolymerase
MAPQCGSRRRHGASVGQVRPAGRATLSPATSATRGGTLKHIPFEISRAARTGQGLGQTVPREAPLTTWKTAGARSVPSWQNAQRARFAFLSPSLILGIALVCAQASAFALPPGDYRFELPWEGAARSYYVHVPAQATSRRLPIVLSLHGGGGNANQHRRKTGMDAAAADRDGYIAVYPNGSGQFAERLLTWNAGNCCGYAQAQGIDDVGFLSAVIDDVERRAAVDPRRVYVVGHSNGGMMAHRVGEVMAERVAAVASVAGAHVPETKAGRGLPGMHIHSVDDPRALFAGGLGPAFPFMTHRVLHPSVESTRAAT